MLWSESRGGDLPPFLPIDVRAGLRLAISGAFPAEVQTWSAGHALSLPAGGTHYGFALGGGAVLDAGEERGTLPVAGGMYFSLPGAGSIRSASTAGAGIVITQPGYAGLFSLGGPVEPEGRLRYIDGCTDTLLIAPPVLGDPCLNLLHIPPHTRQTAHTHPSFRAGIIVSGRGRCVTPAGDHPLEPGLGFVIPEDAEHSFHTDGEELRVIAFHPDSDTGPTHEDHPMVNRTIIDGARKPAPALESAS